MNVRMRTILAGPQQNAQPGQVIWVDDELGALLIEQGYATSAEPAARRPRPAPLPIDEAAVIAPGVGVVIETATRVDAGPAPANAAGDAPRPRRGRKKSPEG